MNPAGICDASEDTLVRVLEGLRRSVPTCDTSEDTLVRVLEGLRRSVPTCDTSEDTLVRVLEGLRRSVPRTAVPDSVFDVLDTVLGPDHMPGEDEVPALTKRMRGSLTELLPMIPLHDATKPDFAALITKAQHLLDEETPGDCFGVRLHLRRMAIAGLGLVDLLGPLPVPKP